MNRAKGFGVSAVAMFAIVMFAMVACSAEQSDEAEVAQEVELSKTPPAVSFKPKNDYDGTVAKPGAPYSISYRIIGTPIVGSPVTVDLRVDSALEPRPLTLDYRINDASAMMFAESQPARVNMEPASNEETISQQVTVIPQRDGRLYLNVSVSFDTETGTMSTVAAIPIQVGSGTRELQENGTVEVDENGEAIRVLTSE